MEGSFNDSRAYAQLKAKLEAVDQQFGIPGSRVYYLSIPPSLVEMSVAHLKEAGMVAPADDHRLFTSVIMEKPIGRDLDSARQVNAMVAKAFAEDQTYRIDHYLGKETVQNLMVLRFANSIFEPLWNQKYIDHVQITVAEEEGLVQWNLKTGEMLGNRLGYYEGVGAIRDMLQNHMLQILCMVAMEPPWSLEPNVMRDAKVGVLRCLRPIRPTTWKKPWCGPSTSTANCMATRCPATARKSASTSPRSANRSRPTRPPKPTWPCGCSSTTGAGPACPSICAPANGCRNVPARWPFSSRTCRKSCSTPTPSSRWSRRCCRCACSLRKGCRCASPRSCRGRRVRIYPVKMEFNYRSSLTG